MTRFLIPNKLKSNDVTENVSSVLDPSKIYFPCTSTTVVESIKPDSKQTNSDELLKLNVLDLSSTCDESAVQPVINFPRTVISGKHRCFQNSWYSKYPWLEYSITLNAVFCYYCRHFPPHLTVSQSHTEKDALINRGYSDWKNISNLTKKHENTSSHKNAVIKYNSWLSTKKTGSVSSQINQQVKDQIINNRETLTSIIRCILYCSRQDIGIREHKKINSTEDNPNWPCHDVNEGNFLEMIKLLSYFSKYTSPDIQNDLIKAASNLTLRKIVKEVNLGSNIFSLIVDEARDESKIEQMSVCIRYIYDSKIKERFLGFIELNELNAQALCNGLILFLNNTGLDIGKCVSQSYDGASVMSGEFSSVQTKIRTLAKNPCPYIHCHAHRLNLVLVNVTQNVQEVGEIIGLLEAVFAFQSVSTLRHYAFFQETNFKIPQHCDTRWVSKYKSIQFFKTHFGSILKVLNTFKESSKKREAAEAKGLILQFAKFEVIVILVCLNEILNIVSCLSINLQSSTLNIGQCTMLIKATKKQISDLQQSLIIAQNANISTPSNNDVSSNRMSQGSSRMTDYYITSTTGKRHVICVEMNRRFDENGEFYAVLGVLDQTSKEFLDCETLCKFGKTFPFYRSDEFLIKLKYQCALGKTLFSSSSGLFELLNEVQSYKVGFEELKKFYSGPTQKKNPSYAPAYAYNKKAWMLSTIYESWIFDLGKRFFNDKRKVLLFVDNCPAHPKILLHELKAILVVFLPPNMTSKLQPMDQGIIKNIKHHYRKSIIQRNLRKMDSGIEIDDINLLESIELLHKSWGAVTQSTIVNCFHKVGFTNGINKLEIEEVEPVEEETPIEWDRYQQLFPETNTVEFQHFVEVDSSVITTYYPTDNEILNDLKFQEMPNESSGEESVNEDDGKLALPKTTLAQALDSLQVVRKYIQEQQEIGDEIFSALNVIENFTDSIIDLASGFYQIKLDEKSKEFTAFSTNQGHWHFKKMAMGLKTSLCSFQRLMHNVMAGIVGIKCLVYLDDIIIYGKGLLDHNEKLRDVFERLRNHNLKIQPTKCEFLKQQCMYLGHIISENGIQPDPKKIKSVLQFPTPASVKEIKSFLGLSGYYRKFIKSYSLISKPMTNLLRKDVTFNWDTSCQEAFDKLKNILCSEPILQYPDFTKPFIVTTDARGKALGVILSKGEVSQDLPIAYASRTLSKCEKEYDYEIKYKPGVLNSNVDALSRMYTIPEIKEESYPAFLNKFETQLTTNKPVKEVNGSLIESPEEYHIVSEIEKHYNFMSGVNYEIKQKLGYGQKLAPSKEIGEVNYLRDKDRYIIFLTTKSRNKQKATYENIYLSLLNLKLLCEKHSLNKLGFIDQLEWTQVRAMIRYVFRNTDIDVIICSKLEFTDEEKLMIFKQCPDSIIGGHVGIHRTIKKIKTQFNWRGLKEDVIEYIKNCESCQKGKVTNKKVKQPMLITSTSSEPFEKYF
ncbi:hypothetical protein QTP88_021270 [Uroleucon formosanum]